MNLLEILTAFVMLVTGATIEMDTETPIGPGVEVLFAIHTLHTDGAVMSGQDAITWRIDGDPEASDGLRIRGQTLGANVIVVHAVSGGLSNQFVVYHEWAHVLDYRDNARLYASLCDSLPDQSPVAGRGSFLLPEEICADVIALELGAMP